MDAIEANGDLSANARSPLRFHLDWSDRAESYSGVDLSTGTLRVELGDSVVWSDDTGFRWAWIELLEWLALSWSNLTYEDGLPFRVDPPTVPDLLNHVERQSKYSSEADASEVEIRLWKFLEAHDVSRALEGAMPPSLILWREGLHGHVLTDSAHRVCSWNALKESLVQVGDEIVERLELTRKMDKRTELALERWRARESSSPSEIAALSSGLTGERLAPLMVILNKRDALWERSETSVARDEVLAAARMTSGLSADLIVQVMQHVMELPKTSSTRVDIVSIEMSRHAVFPDFLRPFEEGHSLGLALRKHLALSEDEKFDPLEWLGEHEVSYKAVSLETSVIDAIACWGDTVGPAVLVNSKGTHSKSAAGRNASLAHEICHLLFDRAGALPAAEVMGGRVNPAVEARARAFAAELLLPRSYAGAVLESAEDVKSAKRAVRSLTRSHRVSQEIVAWQARNSDAHLQSEVFEYLRKLVASPWLF